MPAKYHESKKLLRSKMILYRKILMMSTLSFCHIHVQFLFLIGVVIMDNEHRDVLVDSLAIHDKRLLP